MIFVSTGGVSDRPAWKTSELLAGYGIGAVELSGGMSDPAQLGRLLSLRSCLTFQLHNYFPPLDFPFVFNLASLDPDVGTKSLQHVEMAMQWGVELDRPVYSFHAGYLLDPQVDELGNKIRNRKLYDRTEAMQYFLERVNCLSDYAYELGVELLIENNVLSASNMSEFDTPPLLMLTADECVDVMQQTPNNVNLLIDVAHLKVTANSLNFDRVDFLSRCDSWIHAYHLSDNNGVYDGNESMGEDAWFWPYLKRGLDYYSLELYGLAPSELMQQYRLAGNQLGGSCE